MTGTECYHFSQYSCQGHEDRGMENASLGLISCPCLLHTHLEEVENNWPPSLKPFLMPAVLIFLG